MKNFDPNFELHIFNHTKSITKKICDGMNEIGDILRWINILFVKQH